MMPRIVRLVRGRLLSPLLLAALLLCCCLLASLTVVVAQPDIALANNAPVTGSLPASSSLFYTFNTTAAGQCSDTNTVLLSVAATVGFPTLYASPNVSRPDASTALYTGSVVAIPAAACGVLFLAVSSSAYSACNFTILASSYDPSVVSTTTIPLYAGRPEASYIGGNEYRYFTLMLAAPTAALYIADTQASTQTTIVVNGPSASALPTLSSCTWTSFNSSLSSVAISSPALGAYSIGVWSASAAAFTLSAVPAGGVWSMTPGVTYPGQVAQGQWQYYSLWIDAGQLPTSSALSFNLYSLNGDADLYCGNTTQYLNSSVVTWRWESLSGYGLDQVNIPGSLLVPGWWSCGVYGWSTASSYTLLAAFQGSVSLTPQDVLLVQSAAGTTQLYTTTVVGNATSSGSLLISANAAYGGVQLGLQPYPLLPTAGAYNNRWYTAVSSPMQALQVPISTLCQLGAIPGSDPPLCGLSILVQTADASVYRIAVSDGQVSGLSLLPGQAVEGAVTPGQSTVFTFEVPCRLCNVSLLVTMEGAQGSANLSVSVVQVGYSGFSLQATQLPGSPLIYLTFDWTNPGLNGRSWGSYAVYITAAQSASFDIVYTVSNGSGYTANPTTLVAGESQWAALPVSQFQYFTFTPPAEGWPYTVVLETVWVLGYGSLFASSGDGSVPGPSPESARWSNPVITISPGSIGSCTPGVPLPSGLPCLYQLTVLASFYTYQGNVTQFVVTAASGSAVRIQYASFPALTGSILAGSTEYWQTYYYSGGDLAKLLTVVSMQAGQAALFGSNLTARPNASTAQQTATALSTVVLTAQGTASTYVRYWVAVQCGLTADCVYSVTAAGYLANSSTPSAVAIPSAATCSGALLAGDLSYYYTSLTRTNASYATLTLTPIIGDASVYIALAASYGAAWPSESQSTWSAVGPGPLSLELFNLTLPYLMVGVRCASSGSACVFDLSASLSGLSTDLTSLGSVTAILSPAFPASYFRYNAAFLSVSSVLYFVASSSACASGLQLYVSDATPSPGPGTSYNFSNSGGPTAEGIVDVGVIVTSSTAPAGSLHAGWWYFAVVGSGAGSCIITASSSAYGQAQLIPHGCTSAAATGASGPTPCSPTPPRRWRWTSRTTPTTA